MVGILLQSESKSADLNPARPGVKDWSQAPSVRNNSLNKAGNFDDAPRKNLVELAATRRRTNSLLGFPSRKEPGAGELTS
jgi:hypothetical protein